MTTTTGPAAPTGGPGTPRVVDFEGLRIEYDDRVLTPRPWTAAQSHWAAEVIAAAPPGPVLELCSGAGHIGLLAHRLASGQAPDLAVRDLVCVDADPVACGFLRRNAAAAEVVVDVREGPMDRVLDPAEAFAVVIADPPWVPREQVEGFPEDPVTAIDGGADGLDLVRSCLAVIEEHLVTGGSALLQVGPEGQADRVRELVATRRFLHVSEVRDFERGSLVRVDRPV